MYEEVAANPEGEYHFYTGRRAAEMYGYQRADLDAMPEAAVAAFAGVGCPIERAQFKAGERVVDLGSGAGLDSLIAARSVGHSGSVIGVELNPKMIAAAEANRAELSYRQAEVRGGGVEGRHGGGGQ